jgi:single-strand DNA-binding protein
MAGCLNRAELIGHLGKDPEVRALTSGDRVANFRMATSETWRDKHTGEKQERTEWHSIVVWGPLVDVVSKYLRKCSRVLVEGQLQTRKWQDQGGVDRYTTEIVLRGFGARMILLDSKNDGGSDRGDPAPQSAGNAYREASQGSSAGRTPPSGSYDELLDDEIPF